MNNEGQQQMMYAQPNMGMPKDVKRKLMICLVVFLLALIGYIFLGSDSNVNNEDNRVEREKEEEEVKPPHPLCEGVVRVRNGKEVETWGLSEDLVLVESEDGNIYIRYEQSWGHESEWRDHQTEDGDTCSATFTQYYRLYTANSAVLETIGVEGYLYILFEDGTVISFDFESKVELLDLSSIERFEKENWPDLCEEDDEDCGMGLTVTIYAIDKEGGRHEIGGKAY